MAFETRKAGYAAARQQLGREANAEIEKKRCVASEEAGLVLLEESVAPQGAADPHSHLRSVAAA